MCNNGIVISNGVHDVARPRGPVSGRETIAGFISLVVFWLAYGICEPEYQHYLPLVKSWQWAFEGCTICSMVRN